MSIHLILASVMSLVAIVFLILSFVFPSEIRIGAFIASLLIAFVFYGFYKKEKKEV